MTSNNKVIITGSSGYVGSIISKNLTQTGVSTLQLVRTPQRSSEIRFVLGDNVDLNIFSGAECLIHCAWDMKATSSALVTEINIEGSKKLFLAAHKAGIQKLIFISSISAFEGCSSHYGLAKLDVERVVLSLGGIVVRPGLVYGDNGRGGGMIGSLNGLVAKLPILPVLYPDPDLYMVHETDLSSAILQLISTTSPITTPITAASETPISFSQLLKSLASIQGTSLRTFAIPWQFFYLPLVMAETIGLKPGFKSDSLIGLVRGNPHPDFASSRHLGLTFRPPLAPQVAIGQAANLV